MKNEILTAADEAVAILKKNSPKILLVSGIGLSVAAAATSGLVSYKAADIVRDIKCDPRCDDKKEATKAYFKRVVPLYIPVAILEAGSVVCLVKSYDINAKRLAAATALAEVSMETLRIFKDKAKKELGEEKVKEIEQEVIEEQNKVDEKRRDNPDISSKNSDVVWFRDSITKQEFVSTINNVTRANLKLVERMSYEYEISVNEWMDILKDYTFNADDGEYQVDHVCGGDDIGWYRGETIEVRVDKLGKTKTGMPCFVLEYSAKPKAGYRDRYYEGHRW